MNIQTMKNTDTYTVDPSVLVDIRHISVDKDLPKQERIAEYLRQIKNPYHFKCGDFIVTVKFAENGPTLEDCLRRIMD